MRMSNLLMPTLREVPAEAEITSHKLMLRAGLIRYILISSAWTSHFAKG